MQIKFEPIEVLIVTLNRHLGVLQANHQHESPTIARWRADGARFPMLPRRMNGIWRQIPIW